MADDKKGFILYADLLTVVEKLVLKDRLNNTNYAGELFYHVLQYVNDLNPIPIDFIIEMSFEPIKLQLKRDLVKWERTIIEKSKAGHLGGLKSGEARRKQKEANEANASKSKQNEANEAVNVTVSVNDTVNVMNKKTTSKFEINEIHSESLLKNEAEIEAIEYQVKQKITVELLKMFNYHLKTEEKFHVSEKEYKKHLRNWITSKPENKNGSNTSEESKFGRITYSKAEKFLNTRSSPGSE
jgi:hypothetical protein